MKKISMLLIAALLLTANPLRAQDAALEERVNKLAGALKDFQEAQDAQRRQIEALAKNIDSLRERMNQSNPDVATQEDIRKLAEKLREVDEKRKQDVTLISKEIENLGKAARNQRPPRTDPVVDNPPRPVVSEKGYEYEVQTGDTLSAIATAYRDQGIKVTVDSILKANPGLKPTNMRPGQKLFIPAPQ